MIDKSELTETEKTELKMLALTKKKEQLEKELEDLKLQGYGLKKGTTFEQLKQYFQD